jgi:hypothetical protein
MCIAVGNESFDDMPQLTWSFGCTGFLEPTTPPMRWIARLEMTSFTFMFVCVPLPVWNTTSGKCSSQRPARISSHTSAIFAPMSAGRMP